MHTCAETQRVERLTTTTEDLRGRLDAAEKTLAETEAARVVALLTDSGFDLPQDVDKHDAPRVAFEQYGDVYSALYRKIADATPKALTKTFSWNGDEKESGVTRAEAASVFWFQRGEVAEGHGGVETGLETGLPKAPLNSGALDEKEKPGTLVAAVDRGLAPGPTRTAMRSSADKGALVTGHKPVSCSSFSGFRANVSGGRRSARRGRRFGGREKRPDGEPRRNPRRGENRPIGLDRARAAGTGGRRIRVP